MPSQPSTVLRALAAVAALAVVALLPQIADRARAVPTSVPACAAVLLRDHAHVDT